MSGTDGPIPAHPPMTARRTIPDTKTAATIPSAAAAAATTSAGGAAPTPVTGTTAAAANATSTAAAGGPVAAPRNAGANAPAEHKVKARENSGRRSRSRQRTPPNGVAEVQDDAPVSEDNDADDQEATDEEEEDEEEEEAKIKPQLEKQEEYSSTLFRHMNMLHSLVRIDKSCLKDLRRFMITALKRPDHMELFKTLTFDLFRMLLQSPDIPDELPIGEMTTLENQGDDESDAGEGEGEGDEDETADEDEDQFADAEEPEPKQKETKGEKGSAGAVAAAPTVGTKAQQHPSAVVGMRTRSSRK